MVYIHFECSLARNYSANSIICHFGTFHVYKVGFVIHQTPFIMLYYIKVLTQINNTVIAHGENREVGGKFVELMDCVGLRMRWLKKLIVDVALFIAPIH